MLAQTNRFVLRRFFKSDRPTRSGAVQGRVALATAFLLLAFRFGEPLTPKNFLSHWFVRTKCSTNQNLKKQKRSKYQFAPLTYSITFLSNFSPSFSMKYDFPPPFIAFVNSPSTNSSAERFSIA